MSPVPFSYRRAESIDDAVALLVEHGDDAKIIAGGHSLLPIMKLRFAAPELLIDLGGIADLDHIRLEGDEVAIGALARHVDLELSVLLRTEVPLLAHTAGVVGDCQIRHRGTLGGSVAHGDPSADLPATLMALRGSVVVEGPGGRHSIEIDDFYTGFLETALAPDELVVELRVPRTGDAPWGYQKFRRRGIDWAIVGVAYQAEPGGGGIGLVNMGPTTLRARASEAALHSGADHDQVAALAADGTSPVDDGAGSSEYRQHLSRVLLTRALAGRSTT